MSAPIPESTDIRQAVYDSFYSELGLPDQRQVNAFKQYMHIVEFAFHMPRLDNILELGGGFSTFLLAQLAALRKCRVYSVDIAENGALARIKDSRSRELMKKNIRFVRGATLSAKEFWDFWSKESHSAFGGVSADDIRGHLSRFIRQDFGNRKWKKLEALCGKKRGEIDVPVLFWDSRGFRFPKELVGVHSLPGDEFHFYKDRDKESSGVLDGLLRDVSEFDAIFFDCGEFSAMPEWLKLAGRVRRGGIAIFHDIYYPKSFKNFIVCAAVAGDPHWKIVYQDPTTPQGLMIALRQD